MNYIAVLLLKYIPEEEDAFWCFVYVMMEMGWRGIFSRKQNKIHLVLRDLEIHIKETFPDLYARIE